MKSVIITKAHFLNFKGLRELSIDFQPGVTTISGMNGSGKTTIFDGFLWVLFGKDSQDRKDYNIKTLDPSGEAISRLPHEVSITLVVDGEEINLTRRFTEKWTKKRGSSVEEFCGHETERFINDVPFSQRDYDEKIAQILPASVFKFITNPKYFTQQKMDIQRSLLFRMAGDISDREIAGNNTEFNTLLDALTGKTMEEYKREIGAKKKRIKAEIDTLPARIDECSRTLIESDGVDLDAEVAEKKKAIAEIDKQISDQTASARRSQSARDEQYKTLASLRDAISKKRMALEDELTTEWWQRKNERQDKISELETLRRRAASSEVIIHDNDNQFRIFEDKRAKLLAEWKQIKSETLVFSETEFICPTCGRTLELKDIEKKQREMVENFNSRQAERLAENKRRGIANNEQKQMIVDTTEREKEALRETLEKIKALQEWLSAHPAEPKPDIEPMLVQNLEFMEMINKAIEIENQLNSWINEAADDAELTEAKSMLLSSLEELNRQIAARNADKKNRERIAQLEEQLRKQNDEYASLECIEDTMLQFSKARVEAIESRINALFSVVRFKMFNQQINGGEVETCEAMVNGVPYSSLNNAMQINAGIDIINAICRYQQITAPIFVDNAEAVNELFPTDSQLIRLVVSDSKLSIN